MGKKKWTLLLMLSLGILMASCGKTQDNKQESTQESTHNDTEGFSEQFTEQYSPEPEEDEYPRGNKIEDQTFDVTLNPFGEVTFASYEPDDLAGPLADAVFLIEKGDEILCKLPEIQEGMFHAVEAVSFLDYNNDEYDDVILITSCYTGAGEQGAIPRSRIRYYKGNADGEFSYEEQMSQEATMAIADITIQAAKDFVGYVEIDTTNLESWQQAYIDHLDEVSCPDFWKGYLLIPLSNDEIPQLVKVGYYEAAGCSIVSYAKGGIQVTELSRLSFTYIPNGNLLCNSDGLMDHYYDIVYRIENGEMKQIAEGKYGWLTEREFDENEEPVYQYEWNGVEMSREEYEKEFQQVYDSTQAVTYDYSNLYMLGEIKKLIAEYEMEPGV